MFRQWLWIVVVILTAVPLWAQDVQMTTHQRRVALIIGNKAYTSFDALNSATHNADSMDVALTRYGFTVLKNKDLETRKQMEDAVQGFVNGLDSSSVGLFYYSGRSFRVKNENYFVPVNAIIKSEDDIEDKSLNMKFVVDSMNVAGSRTNILILDASIDDLGGNKDLSEGSSLANQFLPKDMIAGYGGMSNDGIDSDSPNSPYTEALLEVMRESTTNDDIESMLIALRMKVYRRTGKNPMSTSTLTESFHLASPP